MFKEYIYGYDFTTLNPECTRVYMVDMYDIKRVDNTQGSTAPIVCTIML